MPDGGETGALRTGCVETGAVETRWIGDRSGLAALATEWDDLLRASAADTIFLTPEWTLAWLDAYARASDLRALAVRRRGRLIGLALLAVRPAATGEVPARRVLGFAAGASEDSDYLDLIAAPGEEATVGAAVMETCQNTAERFDLLRLNDIPATSPSLPAVRAWLDEHGWFHDVETVSCSYVALPTNWEDYLKMLKPRMRTKVRKLLREIDQRDDARFDLCRDEADLPACLESLYALHGQRWQLAAQDGIFVDSDKRRFYETMSQRFLARGWLRFYSLSIGGRYVAHQFCFERDGVLSLLQEGFDPDWFRAGVGNTLRALVFRDAVERGVAVYDFLAGATAHKLSWGAGIKHSVHLTAAPPKVVGAGYFLPRRVRRWSKDTAKRALGHVGLYAGEP